ncbi:MAG TPA: chorismate synthase [Lachnospiraceae bacterium]
MAGSTFGNIFRISTWGESHGFGIGVVIDGCPAGLSLNEEDIQKHLDRRKPGQSTFTTPRKESDKVEILSGVFEGKTTGTSISLLIRNETQRPYDYSEIKEYYRPGHADFTYNGKYGFRDYRGGGRSSGRETSARVAAGAIAIKILESLGITFQTYTRQIGPVAIDDFSWEEVSKNPLCMPDKAAAKRASDYLNRCMEEKNSSGGQIECRVSNLPIGLGAPVFEKLDANLGKAIFSIGAVKAVEIGAGMDVITATGLTNNDDFYLKEEKAFKITNNAGGILGGISDGSPLILRAAIKPTASIAARQHTFNKDGQELDIHITGRHDPIIVPRAVVVVEAMTALVLVDALLENMTCKMDNIYKIYKDKSSPMPEGIFRE